MNLADDLEEFVMFHPFGRLARVRQRVLFRAVDEKIPVRPMALGYAAPWKPTRAAATTPKLASGVACQLHPSRYGDRISAQ